MSADDLVFLYPGMLSNAQYDTMHACFSLDIAYNSCLPCLYSVI